MDPCAHRLAFIAAVCIWIALFEGRPLLALGALLLIGVDPLAHLDDQFPSMLPGFVSSPLTKAPNRDPLRSAVDVLLKDEGLAVRRDLDPRSP